jgi:hypothetical protein
LAIITMQMMPKNSCYHRVISDAVGRAPIVVVAIPIPVSGPASQVNVVIFMHDNEDRPLIWLNTSVQLS